MVSYLVSFKYNIPGLFSTRPMRIMISPEFYTLRVLPGYHRHRKRFKSYLQSVYLSRCYDPPVSSAGERMRDRLETIRETLATKKMLTLRRKRFKIRINRNR